MTTRRILLMGLNPQATEVGIREWLAGFGAVRKVEIVRDGDATAPVAIVEMEMTGAQLCFLTARISNYWHDGALVSARPMAH